MKFEKILDNVYRKNFHLIVNQEPKKVFNWICELHKEAKTDGLEKFIMDCEGICFYTF